MKMVTQVTAIEREGWCRMITEDKKHVMPFLFARLLFDLIHRHDDVQTFLWSAGSPGCLFVSSSHDSHVKYLLSADSLHQDQVLEALIPVIA